MIQHYVNLREIINIISEDEEEEEIINIINDDEFYGEDEATVSLIHTLMVKDDQHSGKDQATLDLVQSLQTEELNALYQSADNINLDEGKFPPLKSNQ